MTRWTLAEVEAVAPDASSLTAARKLARPGPWSQAGASDTLVWGQCQGSGRTPYQTSVDLTGPAYRCTCPSRKFPCKHALALLLLWAQGDSALDLDGPTAEFAQDWAERRSERAVRAATPRDEPADPEAAARRRERRLRLMDDGIAGFERWLTDLVRAGLAAARRQPTSWWDATAARLVDAQVPGLAEEVRAVGSRVQREEGWTDALLVAIGRWWTLVRAWQGRDRLDPAQTGDLRAALGWAQQSEDVRAADAVSDTWTVLGAFRSLDGRVQQQRTWLQGAGTGETVQLLDFAVGGSALPVAQVTGAQVAAVLSRYPGATPRRATFADAPTSVGRAEALPAGTDLAGAAEVFARALTVNPWVLRVPVVLTGVRLVAADPADSAARALVVDDAGRRVPVLGEVDPWPLLAQAGGHPVDLFGEWEDDGLRLLSAGLPAGVVGA